MVSDITTAVVVDEGKPRQQNQVDGKRAESLTSIVGSAATSRTTANKLLSAVRSKRIEEQTSFRDIDASMWDVALVLGVEPVGAGASAFAALLLALNCVVQAFFLYIIADPGSGLTVPNYGNSTISQFRSWRSTVAHDYGFYNSLQQASLASRVCKLDKGLEYSATQLAAYEDLSMYLGHGDGIGSVGQIMCTIALFVWILTIVKEFNAIVSITRATLLLPRDGTRVSVSAEGELSIQSISVARICLVLVVQGFRFVVGALMLGYGCLFLVYTISVSDLLLNAVALEFVIGIDEVIFETLAPLRVKHLFRNVAGLRLPTKTTWRGLDLGAVAMLTAVLGALTFTYIGLLAPQAQTLVRARDSLCAGDVDFVITRDGIGAFAWAYPDAVDTAAFSKPRNYPAGEDRVGERPEEALRDNAAAVTPSSSFVASAVDVVLRSHGRDYFQVGVHACNDTECYYAHPDTGTNWQRPGRRDCCFAKKLRVPSVDAGRFSIQTKAKETINDAAGLWNPSCFDVLDSPAGYVNILQGTMGDAVNTATNFESCPSDGCPPETPLCLEGRCVLPTCAAVSVHCDKNSVAGMRARQLCPETCGCDAPHSSLVLALPSSGCGDRCVRSGKYLDRRMALPCEDLPQTDPAFASFLDSWDEIRLQWPYDWQWGSALYIEGLRSHGCAFLRDPAAVTEAITLLGPLGWPPFLFGINACVEDGIFFPVKPLSYFCPTACGCKAGDPHCPDSCPARDETTPICPAEHRAPAMDWFNPSPHQRASVGEVYTFPSTTNGSCPLSPKNRF